jgi:predicted short-subunit dehydrogenase-like oxidoreductase (DUF2520 family)
MKKINCIGCGRVGKTILKLIADNHLAKIQGIINQSMASAQAAVDFIGQGKALKNLEDLPSADIYFIGARDDAIQKICEDLVTKKKLNPSAIIMHFSGFLTSDILSCAQDLPCFIMSAHPVLSIADPATAIKNFSGTCFAVEGDAAALATINTLLTGIGGTVFRIKKEHKPQYHAALVMANNYLTTLHYQAVKNLQAAGVAEDMAKKLVSMLMNDSLNNVAQFHHPVALTGPLQRGDTATVTGHMAALDHDRVAKAIYAALGKGTLALTSHPAAIKKEFKKILSYKKIKNPLLGG